VGAAGLAAAGEKSGDGARQEEGASSFLEAFEEGVYAVDLRYRFEFVDDEAFEKDAYASTLRSALGFETAPFKGVFAGAVLENVTAVGNDLLYDNAGVGRLANDVTDRPVVADPALTQIDQAYVGYRGPGGLELQAGRLVVTFDDQRFVGIAPWRQNHRSYDAISTAIGPADGWRARYSYLGRAHYDNGSDPSLSAHLAHLSRPFEPGAFAAYAYLVDWKSEDRASRSSATFGARFDGSAAAGRYDVLYLAEYARQVDYGDNPEEFDLAYAHLRAGLRRGAWAVEIAWELKDGDGVSAVQTPLGTNHGKNGFADKLVVTPPDGSQDRYVRVRIDQDRWSGLVSYHDFQAARGGADLGRELDFQARYSSTERLSLHVKAARYWADTLSTDVTKLMVWTSWSFERS
jgi:hypothetical protein